MKKSVTIWSLLLFIGSFVLFNLYTGEYDAYSPLAKNGILDLREYRLEEGAVELNGEWEFVPDQLLDPSTFDEKLAQAVQVPSLWTEYTVAGERMPKYSKGTYRLRILLPEPGSILGIKTTNIRMSNAIFADGKEIGSSGKPGDESSYSPYNTPYTAYFHADRNDVELVVQVANYDYATGGGIIGSIYFGDQESIEKLNESFLVYDWVTITAFFVMFVFFLGSYLQFRTPIELLHFSLFCLSVALYSASHNNKVIMSVFKDLPYEVFQFIQASSSLLFGAFLLLYFYFSFKQYAHVVVVKCLCILGGVLLGSALLPVRIYSELQITYSFFLFLVICYIFYLQYKAIRNNSVGAVYLTISSVAIFIYFIVGTLNVISNYQLIILPPVLPFIILTMLSLFIANRFSHSFSKKEELSNALIKVDKLKDEFLASTSHEFLTPLHGIIAISQSMLDNKEGQMTSRDKEDLELINTIAERLSNLVKDILDYSKLQQGELRLSRSSVDLHSITHVAVKVFEHLVDKDIQLVNAIPKGQYVLADEGRLRQILYNLLDNAVKYTERGRIEVSCLVQNGLVVIQVSDTGIGIPKEHFATLFEPFQQFENSIGGTGLGLSVTKQLVEIQGGQIKVASAVGEGTTFSFTLPAAIRSKSSAAFEPAKHNTDKQTIYFSLPYRKKKGDKRILIADDNHVNLKVLIDVLESESYSVIAVDNGEAVLAEVQSDPEIDLIILDIMMPGLSGYEVSEQVRKIYQPTELPILMLTAAINPDDMIAAFQSGANDFLHKPFASSELKTRIRNLLLMKESSEAITKMEVAFLQAQIKPHFIYNVLNTILSLSYTDIGKARSLINDFATFLRGSFAFENTSQLVPLERELSLIKSYANIQQIRFPEKMVLDVHVEDGLQCLIPPLLLQPLVENAILHGLRNTNVQGVVSVAAKRTENQVLFRVIDNGAGFQKEELERVWEMDEMHRRGVGLWNIAKRLKHFEQASITIQSEGQGTTVDIVFPFIKEKQKGRADFA
ncbi:hypothetical protein NCCP2222_33060 [Sporosarcina sp. NCCP-2222]|uniref:ATP-binding protein n=1 Tax=Sporosarcina sp. NCCP-2222 TaxID=2935073 RepID=UPI00208B417E|nr:ATP-binding protein [Sporosarcina sp. NCCP-2222]GKV57359.1 hypothetical protein NCCP2222_33060 [Sporosarcina sp. NCCP-2222]